MDLEEVLEEENAIYRPKVAFKRGQKTRKVKKRNEEDREDKKGEKQDKDKKEEEKKEIKEKGKREEKEGEEIEIRKGKPVPREGEIIKEIVLLNEIPKEKEKKEKEENEKEREERKEREDKENKKQKIENKVKIKKNFEKKKDEEVERERENKKGEREKEPEKYLKIENKSKEQKREENMKEIQEKIRKYEEEKEKRGKRKLSQVEEESESGFIQSEDFIELKKENLRQRLQNKISVEDNKTKEEEVIKEIKRIVQERDKVYSPKSTIDFLSKKYKQAFEEVTGNNLKNASFEEEDDIYIPGSRADVMGMSFEIPPFFLGDLPQDRKARGAFLQGLAKEGFYIPKIILNHYPSPPLTFSNMLKIKPEFFVNYGPVNGLLSIFSRPKDSNELIIHKKMSYNGLKQLLRNIPDKFNSPRFIDELITIFYMEDVVPDGEIPTPNKNWVNEAFNKGDTLLEEKTRENQREIDKMLSDPESYWLAQINNVSVLKPNDKVIVLDPDQEIVKMFASDLAKTIKTSLKMRGADYVMGYILGNLTTKEINSEYVSDIIINNYEGTGMLKMVGERYNKSLTIYEESNSKGNKEFHKDYYDKEFINMLFDMGYYYDGEKVEIPKDAIEYLSLTDPFEQRIVKINTHAKGTFTGFDKRDITGLEEINKGLEMWRIVEDSHDNEGYAFFYIAFKQIAAKLKDEIHSFSKPPRFFNPTFIAGFVPFQLMFNKVFSECPPMSEKCPHSLLGIKDVGHNFCDLMNEIYESQEIRYHYSDNFWVKEGDEYVSVDVARCDSNLSRQSLLYPLLELSNMVFEGEVLRKFQIIAKLFVRTIPREAFFSVGKSNDLVLLKLPFFWLPSGVVGTAYFNHLFTGMFLHYTRNDKWIEGKGKLTEKVLEKAQKFGIHLEVASYVNFSDIVSGDCIPFDLLGRSGFYIHGQFIPVLEESRIWKSLLFMKKEKYDNNPMIANFVRLSKMDTLIDLGAMLYPNLRTFLFPAYTAIAGLLRRKKIGLTQDQRDALMLDLESNKMTIEGYDSILFKGVNLSPTDYAYRKTGTYVKKEEWEAFEEKVHEKMNLFMELWAILLPVVQGQSLKVGNFEHSQYSPYPYWVGNWFLDYIENATHRDHPIGLSQIGNWFIKIFGEREGLEMFKGLVEVLIKEFTSPIGKNFRVGVKKLIKSKMDEEIEKGDKPADVKRKYDNFYKEISNPEVLKKFSIEVSPYYNKKKEKKKGISIMTMEKNIKMLPEFFKKVNMDKVFKHNNDELWYMFKEGSIGKRLNHFMSKVLFDRKLDIVQNELGKEGLGSIKYIKKFRDLPVKLDHPIIFDTQALEGHNISMLTQGLEPIAFDLGIFTGLLTKLKNKVEIKNILK